MMPLTVTAINDATVRSTLLAHRMQISDLNDVRTLGSWIHAVHARIA